MKANMYMQEITSKKRRGKKMEILQNLYNLSRPYPRKHSPSVLKMRALRKKAIR